MCISKIKFGLPKEIGLYENLLRRPLVFFISVNMKLNLSVLVNLQGRLQYRTNCHHLAMNVNDFICLFFLVKYLFFFSKIFV